MNDLNIVQTSRPILADAEPTLTVTAPPVDSYGAACAAAATNQGLDPLAYLLDVAGVEYGIEQTGGFCMVLTVRTDRGVLAASLDGETGTDAWMLGDYAGTSWDDGECESVPVEFNLSLDSIVARLKTATGRA